MEDFLANPNILWDTGTDLQGSSPQEQEGQEGNRNSQHRFITGKSCLTNPMASCDELSGSVDEGRALGVIYLDFIARLSSVLHTLQGRADAQRKHHEHRKWVNRSHMKLMWKVLHLGHNSLMNHTGWALTTWTAAPMKRTWGPGRWQVEDEPVVCPCSNKS